MPFKKPVSVLVLIHTPFPLSHILLLERTAHPDYWQSVTGSQEDGETLIETAVREVGEETGIVVPPQHLVDWAQINTYEIFTEWRHRYAPGITHNTEHVFSLEVPSGTSVFLAPEEHRAYAWRPLPEAAEQVFSWSNRDAILALGERRTELRSP